MGGPESVFDEDPSGAGVPAAVAWQGLLAACDACRGLIKEAASFRRRLAELDAEIARARADADAHVHQERSIRTAIERTRHLAGRHDGPSGGAGAAERTTLLKALGKEQERLDAARRAARASQRSLSELGSEREEVLRAMRERMDRLVALTQGLRDDMQVIEAQDRGEQRAFRLQLARQTLADIRAFLGERQ